MKIIVCVKQVPDTAEVRIDPTTGTLIRDGVPSIINPDDLSALESALRLKDEIGAEITVLCMGPSQADVALREALAMGVDRAILLSDRAFAGSDTWATSCALASALQEIGFDLVLTGRQAIDGDTAQVGPEIAEHLSLPVVTYVQGLEWKEDAFVVRRLFEDGYQVLRVKTPCLFTVLKEIHSPRYMRVGKIFSAYREKTVETWTLADIVVDPANLGLNGSPTKVKTTFTKGAKAAGTIVNVPPQEAARIFVEKLRQNYVIG